MWVEKDTNIQSLLDKIKNLEDKVQTGELTRKTDNEELTKAIKELRDIVVALDKDSALQSEKQSHIFYQIGQLEKGVEALRQTNQKEDEGKKDLVEKVFMIILGAVVTYVFSLVKK